MATSSVIPFPRNTLEPGSFGWWREGVRENHPDWDDNRLDRVGMLCMHLKQRLSEIEPETEATS